MPPSILVGERWGKLKTSVRWRALGIKPRWQVIVLILRPWPM
jgi:hypothetical protein